MFRSAGARNPLEGRAFYKHLAPNGTKSNNGHPKPAEPVTSDSCDKTPRILRVSSIGSSKMKPITK